MRIMGTVLKMALQKPAQLRRADHMPRIPDDCLQMEIQMEELDNGKRWKGV